VENEISLFFTYLCPRNSQFANYYIMLYHCAQGHIQTFFRGEGVGPKHAYCNIIEFWLRYLVKLIHIEETGHPPQIRPWLHLHTHPHFMQPLNVINIIPTVISFSRTKILERFVCTFLNFKCIIIFLFH